MVHPQSKWRLVAVILITGLFGALVLSQAVLGNVTANVLQERLGERSWLAVAAFVVVTALVAVFALGRTLERFGRSAISPADVDPDPDGRNRGAMLQKVRAIWIDGRLKQSLYNEVLISLGLEETPSTVAPPAGMQLREQGAAPTMLPSGTRVIDVYDRLGGAMLILGAPGAGKSTMMLDLARSLLDRADADATRPIPVVFNLASWAVKRGPLADWLEDQLGRAYGVPKRLAMPWIARDNILPLLDGLDEVEGLDNRRACVDAINAYRTEHGLTPLVVCSRADDFREISSALALHGAIVLQPLTDAQVARYLKDCGSQLQGMRRALRDDASLREMVDSPLMLSVMALAFQGKRVDDIREMLGAAPERLQHVWAVYVDEMLARRRGRKMYADDQTRKWLGWLAHSMRSRGLSEFYVEHMQPDWLASKWRNWLALRVPRLLAALYLGLSIGVIVTLIFRDIRGLVVGLIVGLYFFLKARWMSESTILPVETLHLRRARGKKDLMIGIVVGGTWWQNFNWVLSQWLRLTPWSLGGLIWLLISVLMGVMIGWGGWWLELETGTLEERVSPNEGLRRSIRNAIVGGLYGVLTPILLLGPIYGLMMSPFTIILGTLEFGGYPVLQIATLRPLLASSGVVPLHLVRFLDFATKRILLRRIGGGYVFVHRSLLEHLAAEYVATRAGAGAGGNRRRVGAAPGAEG